MVVPTIHFIVPVYNEALNIPNLLASFRALSERLAGRFTTAFVVVDDGSRDGTPDLLADGSGALTLTVLRSATNRGPGVAFARGFSHIAPVLADHDWVITMEGDNTSRYELVEQMLLRTLEGYDVVLASPYMYGGSIINTSFLRTFLSYGANVFMKELLEIRGIMTMSSFFRLYRGEVVRRLQGLYGPGIVERRGFDCMVELLMKMVYLQTSLSEVPMVLDTARRQGKSKMKVFRAMRDLLTLIRHKRRWKTLARADIASPREAGALPADHEHYNHYTPEMAERLDGFYGRLEASQAERIAHWVAGTSVLDIGCGFGALVENLRQRGFEAAGVDMLPDCIDVGRKRYPKADLRLATSETLPFSDKSFDTIVLKDTIHHIFAEAELTSFLKQARRICRYRLIVMDPNPTYILRTARRLIGHVDPVCAPIEARSALQSAGFRILHQEFHETVAFPLSGGYVGIPLVPNGRAGDFVFALDRLVLRLLRAVGIERHFCWRYLIVGALS